MDFLAITNTAATIVIAIFTVVMAIFTRRMSDAAERTARVQEQLTDLQKSLIAAEMRPRLSMSVLGIDKTSDRGKYPVLVEIFNLGKYGVEVQKLKHHNRDIPSAPDKPGGAVVDKIKFPRPVASGEKDRIGFKFTHPRQDFLYEVVYLDEASGYILSDLWRYTGREMGFTRVWRARRVHKPQQPQEIHL